MPPHDYKPGACYHMTRRCRDGSFLINPSSKVNQAMLYILVRCIRKYRMGLHFFTYMPNHYHLIISDPHQELGNFLTALNSQTTKCLNDLFRREGYLWEPGACDKPYLCRPADIREAIAYAYLNPVRAGLVARPEDWPGLISDPLAMNGGEISASIPSWYFDPATNPAEVSARLSIPTQLLEHMSPEECLEDLRELIEFELSLIHQGMKARGQTFLGARRILRRERKSRPKNEPRRYKSRLYLICKDPEQRKIELELLHQFRREYREAFEAFRAGIRDVLFPEGTFKMRRDAGVKCRSSSGTHFY